MIKVFITVALFLVVSKLFAGYQLNERFEGVRASNSGSCLLEHRQFNPALKQLFISFAPKSNSYAQAKPFLLEVNNLDYSIFKKMITSEEELLWKKDGVRMVAENNYGTRIVSIVAQNGSRSEQSLATIISDGADIISVHLIKQVREGSNWYTTFEDICQ